MAYTLAEAAAACAIDKSTVRRAVRSGRISGQRNELGVWRVEAAELHRVFPPAARPEVDTAAVPRDAAADAAPDALVAELRAVIADLRSDRDHWRDAFERQQRLLPIAAPEAARASTRAKSLVPTQWWHPWRWDRAS